MSTDTSRENPIEHDVPWLSPDQQRDWRALITLLMTLPPALDAQLKRDAGVNAFEYQVLAALSEAPGRTLVLSNLAALAQGSLSRLSHAITRLERSGWVKRRNCTERGGRRTEARLTDAGFAKKDGVVLLPPAKNLDDPLDLFHSTDDGIKLSLARQLGQIATEAVECGGLAFAAWALFFLCLWFFAFHTSSQKIENLFSNFFQFETQIHQYLGCYTIMLAQQAEQ